MLLFSLLLMTVLTIDHSISINFPPSPCPSIFKYAREGIRPYGIIDMPKMSKDKSVQKLVVGISYSASTQSDGVPKLELIDPKEVAAVKVNRGQNVQYRIDFPVFDPVPMVTNIWLNGREICAGPGEKGSLESPVTSMDMQHLFTMNPNSVPIGQENTFVPKCGAPSKPVTTLVFNGAPTKRGEFPWHVAMYVKDNRGGRVGLDFSCGATLISNQLIVTAAHCLHYRLRDTIDDERYSKYDIVLHVGRYNLSDYSEGDYVIPKIKDIVVHPDYKKDGGPSYDADIALIMLKYKISFTLFITPICLWTGNSQKTLETGTVIGWGRNQLGWVSDVPKKIEIPIVSQETCLNSETSFKHFISKRTFCAGMGMDTGPCGGDSGGGFTIEKDGKWYLRGTVSFSLYDAKRNRCDTENYSVYTDVAKFLPWIQLYDPQMEEPDIVHSKEMVPKEEFQLTVDEVPKKFADKVVDQIFNDKEKKNYSLSFYSLFSFMYNEHN